jgi:hypothetical protein
MVAAEAQFRRVKGYWEANETQRLIWNECVAKFAESLARSASGPPP